MNESVAELQQIEQQCLQKFRERAAKLAAVHPDMSQRMLMCKAIEAMPRVLEAYMAVTQRLRFMGVAAAPLR